MQKKFKNEERYVHKEGNWDLKGDKTLINRIKLSISG